MRKHILLQTLLLLAAQLVFAQSQLGRIEYQKKDRQAVVLYNQYSTDIIEGAVKSQMEKLGNKGKESKSLINLGKGNFISFKGAAVPEIEGTHDLYFKAERRGRKDEEGSVLYMIIGKTADDFASSSTDPQLMEQARQFINHLVPHIEAYNLEVEISNQEALLKKVEGKIDDLTKDSTDLDKRIKNLQDKMQENSKNRQQQASELEKQRLVLEAMKAKRKS
jgi:hypothetical protein